jgi:gamma-glutamyltranspeptidase/glutathione hydrolase
MTMRLVVIRTLEFIQQTIGLVRSIVVRSLALVLLCSAPMSVAQTDIQPEQTVAITPKESVVATREMVVAAHPLAVDAGLNILERGGTAIDAMVAVQMVLNLVEPQSSGIGGGAFLLYHDAQTQSLISLDGREFAPQRADETLFLGDDGKPRRWFDVVPGGLSVGVPGTLALMDHAHARFGRLEWDTLFEQAIALATNGFIVSPRLSKSLEGYGGKRLQQFTEASKYFFPNSRPLQPGDLLKNLQFVETLKTIQRDRGESFYRGQIAGEIVASVRESVLNAGLMDMADLAAYQTIERTPVCSQYRGHQICGMGPPSSGGVTVAQILGILEFFNLEMLGRDHPMTWHLFVEAGKLAFADRNLFLADPDFTEAPIDALLARDYLRNRAALIDLNSAMAVPAKAGTPVQTASLSPDTTDGLPGTSHVSIVDRDGNAVSLTTTIESGFGSGLFTSGFLLNNELTDFSFRPQKNGRPVANRVEPRKRPRSSMAPTIIYGPDGSLKYVLGSPGGSRIISYVAQTIVGLIDFDMSPQEAVNQGRISSRNGSIDIEKETEMMAFVSALMSRGNAVKVRDLNSGIHVIKVEPDHLMGGADPRREGIARGR